MAKYGLVELFGLPVEPKPKEEKPEEKEAEQEEEWDVGYDHDYDCLQDDEEEEPTEETCDKCGKDYEVPEGVWASTNCPKCHAEEEEKLKKTEDEMDKLQNEGMKLSMELLPLLEGCKDEKKVRGLIAELVKVSYRLGVTERESGWGIKEEKK
jgi:hypothetical protein